MNRVELLAELNPQPTRRERLAAWEEKTKIISKIHWVAWALLFGLVIFMGYKTRHEEWTKPEILIGWGGVFVALNALVVTESTLFEVNRRFNKVLNRLEKDIVDLEDATRRNLMGFAQIFDRSLWLLKNAEREIIYANFVLGFGSAHEANESVTKSYGELQAERRRKGNLQTAINDFIITFREKAGSNAISRLKIVTLKEDIIGSEFLDVLAKRTGYQYLEAASDANKDNQKLKNKEVVLNKEKDFRKKMLHALRAADRETDEWRVGPRLPVQILIAGLPPREGSQESRYGCLVFLLGTESLAGITHPGMEKGFYTELQHIIEMYRDFVDNAVQGFETVYPPKQLTP